MSGEVNWDDILGNAPSNVPKKENEKPSVETPKQEVVVQEAKTEVKADVKQVVQTSVVGSKLPPTESPFDDISLGKLQTEPATATTPGVQQQTVSIPPVPKADEFKFEEALSQGLLVITVYGYKGDGKTTASMSLPGTIACLSFDKQSLPIKSDYYDNAERIKVYDAIKYLDESTPHSYLDSAEKTFRYANYLLEQLALEDPKPEWIIIDGTEVMQQICEMTMRGRNNIMPFQGIGNLNLWKERLMYLRQLHKKSLNACSKGVVYTTYVDKELGKKIRDGNVVDQKDMPKWTDIILRETVVQIRVESIAEKTGRKFYAEIENSKTNKFKTGLRTDITSKGLGALLTVEGVKQ